MIKPYSCNGCKLSACGQDFVQIEGLGRFGIMLVGDYSRESEAREGLPFRPHSRGGMIFERTLRRMGFSREMFWVSQAIRCKPWDPIEGLGGLESEVLDYCRGNLIADLKRLKPRVLVAMGNTALRALTGWNGKKRGVHHVRGYVLRALPELCEAAGNPDLAVVPTYDPNHIRNGNTHLLGVFARDIARAVNIRAGKDTSFILDLPPMPREGEAADSLDQENMRAWLKEHNFNYTLHPTIEQVDAFCRDVKARSDAWLALSPSERDHSPIALSHDIETFESADLDEDESDGFSDTKLSLSQFTIEPGQAIAMPWREPFIQATRWLLKLPLPKVGQNYWYFDRRVLKAVGKRDFMHANDLLSNGPLYDTLQQFHYMEPDLPAHLQFAASYVQFPVIWKHLSGENLEAYGCFDTDSALRLFLMTRRTMQDRGIWSDPVPGRNSTGYLNMVQVVRPILEKMENRGLPINNERRLQLGAEFEKVRDEIYLELDRRFPEAARKLTPKDKGVVTGYANMPPAVKAILEEISPTGVPRFTYVDLPGVLNKKTGELGKPRTEIRDAADQKVTKKFAEDSIKNCFKARWDGVTEDEMLIIRCTPFFEPSDEIDEDTGEKIPGDKFYYDRRLIGRQIVNGELTPGRVAWVRVYQFSPNSGAQLMAYMTEKGHEIPYDKKKKKNSTGKRGLERLAVKTGDDFYTKTITCREMDKMGATYVEGFKPNNETGRVHTTFTFATATGQLSSRAPNCFSADTEYLTDRGWVGVADLREDDLVAEWQMRGDRPMVSFSKPLAYIKNWHAGELVNIRTDMYIDMLVTADHDCALQTRTGEIIKVKAADYPEDRLQIQAGFWEGGTVSLRETQVILLAALQADGSVEPAKYMPNGNQRSQGGAYDFGLTKERKAARLRAAMDAEGINYTYSVRKSGQHRFRISRSNQPLWWVGQKEFGDWVLRLDRATLDMLAEELWFWDGCCERRSQYSSSIKQNTDWAQIITILSGRRAKIRLYAGEGTRNDNWQIDASDKLASNTSNRELMAVPYTGYVYCVTMPMGTVVTRRNGKVSFTFQCQNYPAHGHLGKAVKSMIEAPEGYEIANWDFKSFHVLMTGLLAEDAAYMRMARLDMHSFVTWNFLKLPEAERLLEYSDEELLVKFKWLKKNEDWKRIRDKQAKPSILGIALGLMPNTLYEMNLEHFESVQTAKNFRALIQRLFPKVFRMQNLTAQEAHDKGELRNSFGMLRKFYEVLQPDGKGGWKPGDQYNAAIALRVQSNSHGELREKAKQMEACGAAEEFGLNNTIHDSFQFCYPIEKRQAMVRAIGPILTGPSKVLVHPVLAPRGLTLGVELECGKNMADKVQIDWEKLL